MQETKDELDSDNLDKYSLKESSDQDQFKKIQSAFKQQEPIVSQQWNLAGSLKN